MLTPEEVQIDAKSAVLMDEATGQVLLAHNPHLPIPPASFAKLMTLYVIFDALKHGKIKLVDEVWVSKKAWKIGGSKMFIEVNSKVPIAALIKGIAVVSGNDASVAMAEHLYGDTDTFTRVMNKYAQRLGMQHSQFGNPHGFPGPEQQTTAYDMALLARSYLATFPEALSVHAMQSYTYNGIQQPNRNGLLKRDPAVDGLKTGWVEKAGYNLVATSNRDHHRLIAVVMGADSSAAREWEALKLLNYGHRNFQLLSFAQAGQLVATLPVWQGQRDAVPILTSPSRPMVLPRERAHQIRQVQVLPKDVVAPIDKNQVLGKLLITLGSENIRSIPLVAGQAVGKAGWPKVIVHHLYLHGFKPTGELFIVAASALAFCAAAVVFVVGKRRRKKPRYRTRFVR
jgi:D-alanyl-D-alanine carboxypeptidase (penicillin-binding protein 5/6)